MKKSVVLCLFLLLNGTTLAIAAENPHERQGHPDLLQKFKTAVITAIKKPSQPVKIPIQMSYGIRSVKNKAELAPPLPPGFNEQSNADNARSKAAGN